MEKYLNLVRNNRYKRFIYATLLLMILFIGLLFSPVSVAADNGKDSADRYLNILTTDNGPLSINRLLYVALKNINYDVTFTSPIEIEKYTSANDETRDGVIAAFPNLEDLYPNLRRVPAALEQINVLVFAREDGEMNINSWKELDGLNVGILANRTYILEKLPESVTITTKETSKAVLDGLAEGEYDVAVLLERTHETLSQRSDITCVGQVDMLTEYLYLHKDHVELIPLLTKRLKALFADGRADQILNDIPIKEINQKKTVVHIISSNTELTREDQFSASLRKQFENDMSVEWYTVSLDSNRFSRDPNRLADFASLLRQDCVSRNIAAVVVSGYDALEFLTNYYYLFFRNVPVLFYGVSGKYQTVILENEENFTGIAENIEAYETVRVALELFPSTKNIYVVNDYTTEGLQYRNIIKNQLKPFKDAVNIEYSENMDSDLLLTHIKGLPEDSLVLVGSYFADAGGQHYTLNEMKRFLERDCAVPIFSLYSVNVEYNAIGGKYPDYSMYGEVIAHMLQKLMDGANAEDLSIITDSTAYNRWIFDKTQLDRFGIDESALPVGAMVINKIPSIWESDPWFAITLLILLVVSVVIVIWISVLIVNYRKHKEQHISDTKIREVKERLEWVIRTSAVGYLLVIGGKVVEINENMKKALGLKEGDTLRTYKGIEGLSNITERLKRKEEIKNEILEVTFINGEKHRCLISAAIFKDNGQPATVAWVVDTEQSEIQKDQLQTTRKNLQTILDMLPVAVRVVDNESKEITYANKAAAKMFGWPTPEAAYGMSHYRFVAEIQPDGRTSVEAINSVNLSEEPVNTEVVMLKPNGEQFDALVTARLIDYNGRLSSLGIIQDLTAEKEYQRILAETAKKERDANMLKSRFLVNMSHEIRTPMNAIIGLTEIELQSDFPREPKEIYKKINISAKNLLAIINDILDLSKIEADKVDLFEDEFELEEVLNSALLVTTPRLDGKNVEFMLNGALDLPRYIVGDRTRLWQILKNFLDNSAKFTDIGKIVLTVFVDHEHSDEGTVTITFIIEDTGIGMSEEQVKRALLPYQQIYGDAQKRYSGTGLGMTISKQLCELMGGRLKIESELEKGTTVYVSIPFKRSPNNKTELWSKKSPALSGINVLAVDDDRLFLDIIERLLKSNNVNCITAQSGLEAMEIIVKHHNRGEAFDVILLDYMMEGLNGLETARQIQLVLSKVPKLLIVTAYQELLVKDDLKESGIDGVIEKPFIPSYFISRLCVLLGFESDVAEDISKRYTRFTDVNVLLCEDYRMNQEVAIGMMAQFGVETSVAENGSQCIALLNTGKKFDLIFMDLQMPVMDGYEATRIIRADPSFDTVPIIGLTADAMKEIVDKCLSIGMNDHLAKPIEYNGLYKMLQKWLPESKRAPKDEISKPETTQPLIEALDEALVRFGGDQARYMDALLEFSRLLPDVWQDFSGAIEDMDKMKPFIHKLKGASGTLSEKEIYKYAAAFEDSLRGGNPDEGLYKQLIEICNTVKKRILEQAKDSNTVVLASGTEMEFMDLLTALKEALQEYDPETIDPTIQSLKDKAWPSADEQRLKQLYVLTEKFEYDAALGVLDGIMEDDETESFSK